MQPIPLKRITLKSHELVCGYQDKDFNTEAMKHKDLLLTWVGDVVVVRRTGPLMCVLIPIGQVTTMWPISQDITATEIMHACNAGAPQIHSSTTDGAGLLKTMLGDAVKTIQEDAATTTEWASRQPAGTLAKIMERETGAPCTVVASPLVEENTAYIVDKKALQELAESSQPKKRGRPRKDG